MDAMLAAGLFGAAGLALGALIGIGGTLLTSASATRTATTLARQHIEAAAAEAVRVRAATAVDQDRRWALAKKAELYVDLLADADRRFEAAEALLDLDLDRKIEREWRLAERKASPADDLALAARARAYASSEVQSWWRLFNAALPDHIPTDPVTGEIDLRRIEVDRTNAAGTFAGLRDAIRVELGVEPYEEL
jgi:hypothetical protein